MSTVSNLSIIGAGAAGLMAAASALEEGSRGQENKDQQRHAAVVLFEKNKIIGQKVLISGGGRCNVTTGITDIKTVLKKYPRGSKFLSYSMYEFPPEQVREWFEAHGVPLKNEADNRVFPVSDNGHDVVGVFEKIFERGALSLKLETSITEIVRDTASGKFILTASTGETFESKKVILTTGGQAYRATGSTGDGYYFAQKLGHSPTPLGPSLNSFFVQEKWVGECAGVSIEKAKITFSGEASWSFLGDFVFTHKGVSGPAIFALSSYAAFEKISVQHPAAVTIDFFPEENGELLKTRMEKLIKEHPKKSFINIVDMMLPRSLANAAVEFSQAAPEINAAEVSLKQRMALLQFLKSAPLTVIGRGAGEEFVTAGGVPTSEVNPKTMESRLCPGLFFAGEILDIDGFTGGFNLQASWATGRLAGVMSQR